MRRLNWTITLAAACALAILAAAACGDDDGDVDGGGRTDGGRVDAGPDTDSGPGTDGGGDVDGGGGVDGGMMVDGGPPPTCEAPVLPSLATEELAAGGLSAPLFVTQAPGSTDTLWVVERGGAIKLIRDGSVAGTFLTVAVTTGGGHDERGLLGMAFHPDYATNGRFFVYYTHDEGGLKDILGEFHVSSDPDVADATEVQRLVEITDPQENHNGGMVAFGDDGMLYLGVGDGGSGCDPHGPIGNGQNTNTLLGKLLRLDVDNAPEFGAAGNPFEAGGGLPQIWAYGLRNPWRFSFDSRTHDLYIGDVGQGEWEEIDIQPSSSAGGENYGWRAYEGLVPSSASGCDDSLAGTFTQVEPQLVVRHSSGSELLRGVCSIVGGYVYNGTAIPALRGVYLFGDSCSNDIAAFRWCDDTVMGAARVGDLAGLGRELASFGQDNAGELYMVFIDSNQLFRIIPGT